MKTKQKIHREISFSQSFQYHSQYEKNGFGSSAIDIEQKIQSNSIHKNKNLAHSPQINNYYKSSPNTVMLAEIVKGQVEEAQNLQSQMQIPQRKQNFSQINKRIKNFLIDIEEDKTGKEEFKQKADKQISSKKSTCPSDYGKIKSTGKGILQNDKSILQSQNKYFKSQVSKQKKNMLFISTLQKSTIDQNNFKDIIIFKAENVQKLPLIEKKMNINNPTSKIENLYSRRALSPFKNQVNVNPVQKNHVQCTGEQIRAKKIEEQMHLIDNKIQQLQKIKKQLQFQLPNKNNNENSKLVESQITKSSSLYTIKTKELLKDIQDQFFDSKIVQSQSKCSSIESDQQIADSSKIYSKVIVEDIQVPKILMKIRDKKKEKLKETQVIGNSNIIKLERNKHQEKHQYYNEQQQNRKSVINQKNNLLNELHYQIKLDDQFRKSKKWLQKLKINNKWSLLINQLQNNLYDITEQQIRSVFSLDQDQESPFYYPKESDFTIQDCVKAFLAADRHWTYDIANCYSKRSLLASNFIQQNIDINGKGHINIEDLTRYINSQLDKSYRNRDIYLIYFRFKTSEKLYYSKILNCLCNE